MTKGNAVVLSGGNLTVKEFDLDSTKSYEFLRDTVEGIISMPYLSEHFAENGIDIVINDEGKLIDGMRKEIALIDNEYNVLDVIFGNVVFVSCDECGETIGLTDDQINIVFEALQNSAMLSDCSIIRTLSIY